MSNNCHSCAKKIEPHEMNVCSTCYNKDDFCDCSECNRIRDESLNNYELTTDEFNFMYKRYKKTMPWKHFKRKTWVIQQLLCEKWDMKVIDHRSKVESYVYWFGYF